MPQGWEAWWEEGLAAHGRGELGLARTLYDRVLTVRPDLPRAWLARGVAHLVGGDLPAAEADLLRAVELAPDSHEAHNNLAVALIRQDRPAAALAALDRTLQLAPAMAEAHNNRGDALRRLERMELACEAFTTAVRLKPDYAAAWQNLADTLSALGRRDEAITALARLAALAPGQARPLLQLGEQLLMAGRTAEALAAFQAAIPTAPRRADAEFYAGVALYQLGRTQEAQAAFQRAIEADPQLAVAHYNLGKALQGLDRHGEAARAYQRALVLDPDNLEAETGLGQSLRELGRLDEALVSLARVVAARPDSAQAVNNLASVHFDQRRFGDALALFDRAVALDPQSADSHHNRAFTALMLGDFESGFRDLEWRKRLASRDGFRPYAEQEWTGQQALQGRTVFVHWEQGLGDTIQFCRYLPMMCDRGAGVVFAVQDGLEPLIRTLDPRIAVIGQQARPERFDLHVPLMSLPLAFGARLDTMPAGGAYLSADPRRVELWRDRIGPLGFRVGVSWRTSRLGAQLGKSFPAAALGAIAALPGVRLISLQKNEGVEELEALPGGMRVETLGDDFDSGGAFLDSAAVMQSLDLMITVDSALAHLAGALGRPAFVALKHVADWRWLAEGRASPWYPSLTLFRQRMRGDWGPVFEEMRAAIEILVRPKV